jgi:uncharacterized protein (DUF1330 family)
MPVNPSQEQIAAVAALAGTAADGPLVMLNLNRYRPRAMYAAEPPGGVSPDVSGHEAYERYGMTALKVLARVGGEIVWSTRATITVVGDYSDQCDEVLAVRYPSAEAFLALAMDPDVVAALPHREAALERAAIIRCDDRSGPLVGRPG